MPMTLISRQTLTGSAASVTFNNIPQTFQTLKLVVSARSTRADFGDYFGIKINNSADSGYTYRTLEGNGASTSSYSGTSLVRGPVISAANETANTFSNSVIDIPNYAGSTNKPWSIDSVYENNATTAVQQLSAFLYSNTGSIASLILAPWFGPNFVSGSTFSLYGIS